MSNMLLASTTEPKLDSLPSTSTLRQRQTRSHSRSQTSPPSPPTPTATATETQTTINNNVLTDAAALYSLERTYTPYIKILEPLLHRIHCFLLIWTLKILGTLWIKYHTTFNPQAPDTKPDQTKFYPCRPKLAVDIFFPPTYNENDLSPSLEHKQLYPLYISLHGGGLCLGSSTLNNTSDRSWSRRTTSLIASLNYSKSPLSPFPHAAHDIAELAAAVISDPTLPVDRTRVTIGGFSAGALLCLSAVQLPPLRGKCRAAVAYYPCVDFSENPPTKFQRRLDKTFPWEGLNTAGFALDWGYVSTGQDRRDRVLSPWYADHEDLPENVCVVGCQYDMFCREGRDMIFQLAGREIKMGDGEEWKENFETESGRQKWIYARGLRHAFTEEVGTKKGPRYDKIQKYCEWMYDDIHQWLVRRECI